MGLVLLLIVVLVLVVALAVWLRYRHQLGLTYGVASLGRISYERFPAARARFSKAVVVTGGCGFVARRIVQMLLDLFVHDTTGSGVVLGELITIAIAGTLNCA